MDNERPEELDTDESQADSDWENRILCSDGNCIGVIGPDGRCKECGKPYEDSAVAEDPAEEHIRSGEDEVAGTEQNPDDQGWDDRRLCSDGNCIGVIGSDGRCKECGKPYEG